MEALSFNTGDEKNRGYNGAGLRYLFCILGIIISKHIPKVIIF